MRPRTISRLSPPLDAVLWLVEYLPSLDKDLGDLPLARHGGGQSLGGGWPLLAADCPGPEWIVTQFPGKK